MTSRSVSTADRRLFAQYFVDALFSGEPLQQCLLTAATRLSGNPYFQDVLIEVRKDLLQGYRMSSAMAKHPAAFDQEFVDLVRRGEVNGVLDEELKKFAEST